METISFGRFEVNLQKQAISKAGIAIRLAPQPFTILLALLEARGAVVTREELRRRLWPDGTFLEYEQAINVAVRRLREVLGESNSNPIYIETLPRIGYRWIGPLRLAIEASEAGAPLPAQNLTNDSNSNVLASPQSETGRESVGAASPKFLDPKWRLTFRMAALGMIFVVGVLFIRSRLTAPPLGAIIVRGNFECTGCTAGQAYLAPGMADRLASDLIRIPGVHVLESPSASPNPPLRRALKLILTGRVVAKDGYGLAITAFLSNADTHELIWSNQYEAPETGLPALEVRIANDVFHYLGPSLPRQDRTPLKAEWTRDPIAYDLYLRGENDLVYTTPMSVRAAINELNEAVRRDSGFAAAYGGLAWAYLNAPVFIRMPAREAMPLVKANALREIELDPLAPDGRASLAFEELLFEYKWQSAEREFQKALELNPDSQRLHCWYSELLSSEGRTENAIQEAKIGISLDPEAPRGYFHLALAEMLNPSLNSDCVVTCRQALRRFPDYTRIQDVLVFALWGAHRFDEAAEENLHIAEVEKDEAATRFQQSARSILATRGPSQYALAQARYCEPRDGMDYACDATATADWYAIGGDTENALRMLQRAVVDREANATVIPIDVFLAPLLRRDSRFQRLVSEIHTGSD